MIRVVTSLTTGTIIDPVVQESCTCGLTFQRAQIFSHFKSVIYTIPSQDSISDSVFAILQKQGFSLLFLLTLDIQTWVWNMYIRYDTGEVEAEPLKCQILHYWVNDSIYEAKDFLLVLAFSPGWLAQPRRTRSLYLL